MKLVGIEIKIKSHFDYSTYEFKPTVDGHFGCFHTMALINSAAINTGIHISFWLRVFVFSGYMPKSGIAGSFLVF